MRLTDRLRLTITCCAVFLSTTAAAATSQLLKGFTPGTETSEQVRQGETDDGVRFLVNAPAPFDPQRPTLLVVYALPNGNTIEMSAGGIKIHSAKALKMDGVSGAELSTGATMKVSGSQLQIG